MSAFEFEPVEGGVPLGPPEATHPVVVRPTPEWCASRPMFRRTIDAKQILRSRAKGDSVKTPGLATLGAYELPMPVAPRERRLDRMARRPDAVGVRVPTDPDTISTGDPGHAAPSDERP